MKKKSLLLVVKFGINYPFFKYLFGGLQICTNCLLIVCVYELKKKKKKNKPQRSGEANEKINSQRPGLMKAH